jgi:putative spermidine/putrescine transport system permease protein
MKALKRLGYGWLLLVYLFVLAPTLVVVVGSFNTASSFPAKFEGFTLDWYRQIPQRSEFVAAIFNSLVVALCAAAFATVVGFLAGYAILRRPIARRNLLTTLLMSPLLVPDIVIGVAALQMFMLLKVPLTLVNLVALHATFFMPFAVRMVLIGLARFNFGLEEAAASLGASPWRTLRHVTLPLLRPSLVAGFTVVFILSFVNLPLSMFLATPDSATLPIVMFSYIESNLTPFIAAVASLLAITAGLVTFFIEGVLRIRLFA